MKTTIGFLITLLYASLASAEDMSTQINQPIKYASLEEMNLGEFVGQSRRAIDLGVLRSSSEDGNSDGTLELLESMEHNEDLKAEDLVSLKQLLDIADIQKADKIRLQADTVKYEALKASFVATEHSTHVEKYQKPVLKLNYSGETLDDISGVKICGDEQSKGSIACFETFNDSLKADYNALKSYNLAIGWTPDWFQPDELYEKARKACGSYEYCTAVPLYLMNQTLINEGNESRFKRTYEETVNSLLTVPVAKIIKNQPKPEPFALGDKRPYFAAKSEEYANCAAMYGALRQFAQENNMPYDEAGSQETLLQFTIASIVYSNADIFMQHYTAMLNNNYTQMSSHPDQIKHWVPNIYKRCSDDYNSDLGYIRSYSKDARNEFSDKAQAIIN